MSSYIGTRNIGQVRSHLQKYLLKQKKLKEKKDKNILNKNDKNKKVQEEININNNTGIQLEEKEEDEKIINLEEKNNIK